MNDNASVLGRIRLALHGASSRKERLERIGALIRQAGGYRWVGIYDVTDGEISVIAWSGPGEPAYPRSRPRRAFAVTPRGAARPSLSPT